MVQGGSTCVKYLLFFFNLLFVLTGLAVIIVGAVIETKARDYFNFLGKGFTSTAVLLIVVGVIIFLIAFFGCCGAIKENHCMVITFSVLLSIIFIMEFSAGIAGYVYRGNLKGIVTEGMQKNIQLYNQSTEVKKTWDDMQKSFHCCGVFNESDYQTFPKIPTSCCNGTVDIETDNCTTSVYFKDGCANVLFDDFKKYQTTIGGVGIGIAFVQIAGIVLACCLANAIKKQYEVV